MDLRVSRLFIQLGFWACICAAFVMGSLAIASIVSVETPNMVKELLPFIDVILLIVVGYFIHKKSRVAAFVAVLYQLGFHVIWIGSTQDYLQILWFVFFILGFLGTLRYKKIITEQGLG